MLSIYTFQQNDHYMLCGNIVIHGFIINLTFSSSPNASDEPSLGFKFNALDFSAYNLFSTSNAISGCDE